MPQLVSSATQPTTLGETINRFAARMVPQGFDPTTPESAVATGPIGNSANIARREGPLAGIASLAPQILQGRGSPLGGDPAQNLLKFKAIARRMGIPAQDIEDAGQVGYKANLEPSVEGQNPNLVARHGIMNDLAAQTPKGNRSSADYKAIQKTVADYEQLKGRAADSGDDFALYHMFRNSLDPADRKGWTPSKFLDVKNSAPRAGSLSLDDVSARGQDEGRPLQEMIGDQSNPDPAKWAEFAQRFSKLNPTQQANFQRQIAGMDLNPSTKARLMGKIGDRPSSQDYKPISGGSGDQFTNPSQPAFSAHSLYNVKQAPDANTNAISPRDLIELSRDMKLGPGAEAFYGQRTPHPNIPEPEPEIMGRYGNLGREAGSMPDAGPLTHPDTNSPGPVPPQGFDQFKALQRMILGTLLNSGRN